MKKNNYIKFIFILLFFVAWFGFVAVAAKAQTIEEPCTKMTVSVVLRNSGGDFIPNANFEIYQQVDDVDGSPKPGKKVASGKIDQYLGRGTVTFTDSNYDYAVKAWTVNNSRAAFWFYNDLHLACGGTTEISQSLSALNFVLRDSQNELRKNTAFSVYTQREDADNKPIKEKLDLIGTFNTGETGEVRIYLPSGSRAVDGDGSGYYVFEAAGKTGGMFTLYDIAVSDHNTTNINYVFSDMKIKLTDSSGQTFPGNTKIEIYKQIEDLDGNKTIGSFVKDIFTDDSGIAIMEYPAGEYAGRIKGLSDQYQYFWDLEIVDRRREEYELASSQSWDPGQGACTAQSLFIVYPRNLDDKIITGLKFEIYERILNADSQPIAGAKLGGGTIDSTGKGEIKVNPDSRKKYAMKIYDKNAGVGDFWYFDEIQFICGENKEIIKLLPFLKIILRDGNGQLKKNQAFSLYQQELDEDGKPMAQASGLVGNFSTTGEGSFLIYLAPDHPYDANKRGLYVLSSPGGGGSKYNEYNIEITADENYDLEYIFSDMIIALKDSSGRILKGKNIDLYEQIKLAGKNTIGKKFTAAKTDDYGQARIEYPAGQYAVVIKDDLGKNNIFWDVIIKNRLHNAKDLSANLTRISGKSALSAGVSGTSVNIYSLTENGTDNYVVDKKIKSVKVGPAGYAELSLAPSPYLFTMMFNKTEYGRPFYAENGKLANIIIEAKADNQVTPGKKYKLAKPASATSISERLKGYILLQVEELGEAWYVNPNDGKRYYLADGEAAYEMMRKFGLGITNDNLKKIIIGVDDRLEQFDYDGDGLPDDTEEAIGTYMRNRDSDNDGFTDGEEASHGYNPLGTGKLPIDINLAQAQKGKILLQVEANGEAWYVNPRDNHRFYMKDGDSAYEIMRFMSLGIKNSDLEKIEIGVLK